VTRKSSKKNKVEQVVADSDGDFAYIAGYTDGGAPYGVTREELELFESLATAPLPETLPVQGSPVALNDIVREMRTFSDMITVYFKRTTGEFIAVTDEYIDALETEEFSSSRPEWELKAIEMTEEVLAHENDGDYVPLPSKYDIHEYYIMERFCEAVKNAKISRDLCRSISGKGAFRRFKSAIRLHGIERDWYEFEEAAYKEIAKEWCTENSIIWQE
jgi:hypothetical protein